MADTPPSRAIQLANPARAIPTRAVAAGIGLLTVLLVGATVVFTPSHTNASRPAPQAASSRVPTSTAVTSYLKRQGLSGLNQSETLPFAGGYWVVLTRASDGHPALSLLVKQGRVAPAGLPDAQWNQVYGAPTVDTDLEVGLADLDDVSASAALATARSWAAAHAPGATLASPVGFFGYYTVAVMRSGRVVDLVSVRNPGGEVWVQS